MRGYKFLVMQANPTNNVAFLTADLNGSGRSANHKTNVTDFDSSHDNRSHWNSADKLIIGFTRWYLRINQKEAYNMGNRLYSATNTYRFFRVDTDLDDYKSNVDQVELANNDLKPFEITEAEFISNIFNSWAWQQVSKLFPKTHTHTRPPQVPVEVEIVYNSETKSWCWISDYLQPKQEKHLTRKFMKVTIGLHHKEAVKYINARTNCKYRFGGNDEYYKREALKLKETK
ncbi:hypothetical protein COPG_00017 [Colwellia phage 9A]|uniref:Uncharacterized protein n=1 Tax=Colwellia phage 9A TaxID=765765 RepID=I3UM98_9CAUD|nr:hypothetical protein COPG_00017 [Colwellia phage 9A]AFK66613.1 hypothetical protein COPG_00017 [Colwellia phage 9A]